MVMRKDERRRNRSLALRPCPYTLVTPTHDLITSSESYLLSFSLVWAVEYAESAMISTL